LKVAYVPTKENWADGLTKALGRQPFELFRNALGVVQRPRHLLPLPGPPEEEPQETFEASSQGLPRSRQEPRITLARPEDAT
jgi:hypothetical protein